MPVYCVPNTGYQQLICELQLDTPKSLSIIWTIENVIKGRLSANFYVDKWPGFSAVVGELIWPRRSDVADIVCYATNSEALLSVLTKGNLVSWGKRQEFQRIEDRHADFLLKNFKYPGDESVLLECIHERELHYYSYTAQVPSEVLQGMLNAPPPDGFVYGKLQSHHAPMVTAHWPRLHGWPNKESYFREIIENYSTTALFHVDNLDIPVTYLVQFPCGQSFAFTTESYRGKGLSRCAFEKQFAKSVMDGFSPRVEESSVGDVVPIRKKNGVKLFNVKDLILKHTLTAVSAKI